MTETNAPVPRPTDRKNDMAAPATSLFSQLTRLTHTKTHKHALSGVPNVPLTLTERQTDRQTGRTSHSDKFQTPLSRLSSEVSN